MPIIDLCAFFGHELSPLRKQRRVLVIDFQGVFVGLLIDEVLGMQHFSERSLMPEAGHDSEPRVAPYIQGRFVREQAWQVFSPRALVQSPDFMDVAATRYRTAASRHCADLGPLNRTSGGALSNE